jgi:hypothetical protein
VGFSVRGASLNELLTPTPFVPLEVFSGTCYLSTMSDRLYSKSCPECGGVCPLQAQTCRYCGASFPGSKSFSLNWSVARAVSLRKVAIWVAILMIVVFFVINILRG